MPFLTVWCCTWNVGDEGPPKESLEKFLGLEEENSPDIVAVALQEVVEGEEWRKKIIECLQPAGFALVKARNCWAIWMLAFVRRNLLSAITNIESEVTPCGLGGVMGNKGGVSVRFEICGVNVIFLSCHFAAHTERKQDRLNDYLDIIGHQSFRDSDVHSILDHDYVFWMGDLNFRLENIDKKNAEKLIVENRLSDLLEHDQLVRSKARGLTFGDFHEGVITFPPTFKFDKGTHRYDTSEKQRVPAWTDRILYMYHHDFAMEYSNDPNRSRHTPLSRFIPTRGAPSEAKKGTRRESIGPYQPSIVQLTYTNLPEYTSSDHRPVVATFSFSIPPQWFSLPVSFIQPMAKEHSVNRDLEFVYTVLDPPTLLCMAETDRIISSRPSVGSVDFIQLMLLASLTRAKTEEEERSSKEPSPAVPLALEQASYDWIGLYPADVGDVERDYLTYVWVPKASRSGIREALALSSASSGPIYQGKISSSYLTKLKGLDVQLVYWSKVKNCPQGYSTVFTLND